MEQERLTRRQADVYRFIRDFAAANRYLPSQRQIADGLGMCPTTARGHVCELVRKGFLGMHHHETRGMWLAVELTDEQLPKPTGRRPPVELTCPGCGARVKADPQSREGFQRLARAFQNEHAACSAAAEGE
ncbi:MAG TPA: hypothetical protein PLY56_14315 [Armatimonadota bacterium]|jgi:SOS-response transcriptional repressor LexA|nr:hypothetical protein [Armatimonadota bacterium]